MSEIQNNKKYHIVQGIVEKSADFSLKIYNKVGLHNIYIEDMVKLLNQFSAPFIFRITCLLDSQINQTIYNAQQTQKTIIYQTNKKKQELIEKTQQTKDKLTKNQLIVKVKNSKIAQKADDYGNIIIDEIEQQLVQLKKQLAKTLNNQYLEEEKSELEDQCKLDLYLRANKLGHNLNSLGKQVIVSYMNYLQSLPVIQLAHKQYTAADAKFLVARANIESFIDVVFCTVLTQNIINPILSVLQVQYNKSKESVIIIIQNIKNCNIKQILALAKYKYETLYQTLCISLKQNKLSLIFTKDFYIKKKSFIQNDIKQLMFDVNSIRIKAIEKGIDLYKQSLEQFKIKLELDLYKQSIQQFKIKKIINFGAYKMVNDFFLQNNRKIQRKNYYKYIYIYYLFKEFIYIYIYIFIYNHIFLILAIYLYI
ncbi:hypothetical protein IMG5_001120 [Ichthyophthirius multifiliis]|uniref:Uncharacterized protein n=1 Tax=Ichthyophthirius multifiliis TaxID=5932 RepID=G0QIQ3_ICHMU|nr:hypothetical protein IMG5_001120 [Ichthyophthirius multifiliis]EGR34883.1 hypothetical protein IMG5_001120 [Ichthyophthirius multifiliis]|eukprot:XP_004040187.1 hypothetical protein IMG5_001120 [Ichthyophthirius multifiliis]